MVRATEKLNFKFYLTLVNLNLNIHTCPVITVSGSTALASFLFLSFQQRKSKKSNTGTEQQPIISLLTNVQMTIPLQVVYSKTVEPERFGPILALSHNSCCGLGHMSLSL